MRAANLRAARSPQHQTVSFYIRGFLRLVTRRHCTMRRQCTTRPLGQLILCARMGARARSFKPDQNRTRPSAGPKEDLSTLMRHHSEPQLCIRRKTGRMTDLSLGLEGVHKFPRRGLPSSWWSRSQCRRSVATNHFHPRPIGIRGAIPVDPECGGDVPGGFDRGTPYQSGGTPSGNSPPSFEMRTVPRGWPPPQTRPGSTDPVSHPDTPHGFRGGLASPRSGE